MTLFITFLLSIIGMTAISPTAYAVDNPSFCDSSVPTVNQDFGTKVPVILIHGMNGNPGQWQSPKSDIESEINARSDTSVALNYDYDFTLDSASVGHDLAKAIDCISLISKQSGGKGKVVLIGYSQGGLVADNADDRDIVGTNRNTADEIGQIITIATPNTNPNYAAGIVLHTVTANTKDEYYDNEGGTLEITTTDDSDGIFPNSSQVGWETSDSSVGGGSTIVTCTVKHFDDTNGTSGSNQDCQHGNLLGNSDIEQDVQAALSHYVSSLNAWPTGGSSTELYVNHLKMYFDNKWQIDDMGMGEPGYGAFGPGGDFITTESSSQNLLYVINYAYCASERAETCIGDYQLRSGSIEPIRIGGRSSDLSFKYPIYNTERFVWCFTDTKVCVYYLPQTLPASVSTVAYSAFSHAVWYWFLIRTKT